MRKALATLLIITFMCIIGGWINPQKTDFSLINYLETHEVTTYEEFIEIIEQHSPKSVNEEKESLDDIAYFHIDIDYEDRVVSVVTMGEASYDRSQGASNSASKKYYNDLGVLIFTITVSGSFKYSSGTCTATSNGGSYTKPFYSTWSSTPVFSKGNISTSKAYARTRGTATSGSNTKTYSLTLTCDDSGNFSSY